ncbi:MAG TPA: MBL fold metallo-hydrolase [Candidatus Kapabacteria bacterium]|nr:MBL fold metallo-hydrolase [Candidatus Kapabacteria bacterium]
MNPLVEPFFDPDTFTISYVVHGDGHPACAIIDPVLDYDARAGRVATHSAQRILDFVASRKLRVEWILETHAHADHLSAAQWLKRRLGGQVGIGEHIREVQQHFARLFGVEGEVPADGSQFDCLLRDGDRLALGDLQIEVLHTPGHTNACVSFRVGNAVFVGDTLFMPDYGTARTDFPGGDAATLYRSIRRILALPADTRLFLCHDYRPGGRPPAWESTVAEQRAHNLLVHDGVTETAFVADRKERDSRLSAPALILPALQVNIRGGHMPEPATNGTRYLKIPLNRIGGASDEGLV